MYVPAGTRLPKIAQRVRNTHAHPFITFMGSHEIEKVHDENVAIAKIKCNPNYLFGFAKKIAAVHLKLGH